MTSYTPPPPPPPSRPPQPPQPHRPTQAWYKRTWFLLTVTALVALGIGAAAGGSSNSAASGDKSTTTATATVTASSTLRPTATTTVTTRPTIKKVVATKIKVHTSVYTPPPKPAFGDGTYKVGQDIKPGTFRTAGGSGCYYARLRNLNGGIDSIINNDNFDGPSIVHLNSGEYFEVSGGCNWRHE